MGSDSRNWEQEYERLLQEAREAKLVEILPGSSEKRRHPRFRLPGTQILVTEQVPHEVVDLSISGLAFYSERKFAVGQRIMVSLREILAIGAEVLGCDALNETDAPAPFKIRCQYVDSDYGLRFLVLAAEVERGRKD